MKTKLPHIGEVDICIDDSCDGNHCRVCGCHFADWYHGGPICDSCIELSTQQMLDIDQFLISFYSRLIVPKFFKD
jgi:hypothetical protein